MLELRDIVVRYGPVVAVDRVSIRVEEQQVVALLGANGAGKTTVLKAISGLLPCASGDIAWGGGVISKLPPHRIVRAGICQVPEGREVFAGLSVYDNLRLGAYLRRNRHAVRSDIDRMYEYFPVLAERRDQAAGTLSGGEQQMLVIARALMSSPAMLLLDEPSLGLAPLVVQQVFSILRRICDDMRLSVLLVEQDAETALSIASYAYVLEAGRVVVEGSSVAMQGDESLRRSYLGY
ncbi:MAG: transporter ATP-binding protein [Marmoricola sp.]|jgi:branched-chain amino acid transport system ATP-binding protein|nr:transporter ATP-binding protein [Marmoricola sp.]